MTALIRTHGQFGKRDPRTAPPRPDRRAFLRVAAQLPAPTGNTPDRRSDELVQRLSEPLEYAETGV